MAENNLIGEEFEEYVRKQINVRQKIHGSGTSNNPRPIEYLNYLNSKTAWVKLASGVNISEERLQREGMDTSFYGMELAKERVLFGGVASLEGNKLTQRGTNSNRNLNITDPNSGTYNVNQKNKIDDLEFGLVPMPGIISVDIKNKNRGSIKEATIKITAYTREQFDFIDLLYMRLGYTVFLEWGWSTYFDNDENGQTMDYTLIEDSDGFFNPSWGHINDIPILTNQRRLPRQTQQSIPSKTFSDFLNKITEYRGKHDGNYDGLLAKVRNFDWTISENGTYDITLSLISVGDVIESLKMNMPPTKEVIDFFTTLNTQKEQNKEEGEEVETFPIDNSIKAHLSLWKLSLQQSLEGSTNPGGDGLTYRLNGVDVKSEDGSIAIGRFVKFIPTLKIPINDTYHLWNSQADNKISELNKQYKEEIKKGEITITVTNLSEPLLGPITYLLMPSKIATDLIFGDLYRIDVLGQKTINLSEITSDESESGKEVFVLNNLIVENKNISFDSVLHFHMRLGYLLQYIENTIIPLEKNTSEKMIKIHTDQWDSNRMYHFPYQQSYDPRVCLVRSTYPVGINRDLEILPQLPGWFEEGNDYAWLMNIYVTFSQIESSINDNLDEQGNLSLFDFLSSLCTSINKALGGVNNLEPVIEEETNTIRIIDGSYTSNKKPATDYALELYGYNPTNNSSNFVRNFSVKSTISKEYASMISIGATAAGYTKGMEATMFSKWNTGIIDRFKEEYVPPDPSTNPTGSENEAVINYIENILLKNPTTLKTPGGVYYLDTEIIDTQVSFATEFYKYCQYQFKQKYPKYGSPIIGFVPISLNLTMDGISGMKIYNVVRTSTRFLPKNYTDSLRFITTSVNHKLNNNDWETTIDTVVIPENYDELGNEILPYNARFEEVKRILIESATLKYGPQPPKTILGKGATGGGGSSGLSEPSLPPPTSIGEGDKIRVDADLTTPWKHSSVDGNAQGAYRYLQIITKDPLTGNGNYYTIPGTTCKITSGFGQRNVTSGTHQAVDVAAGGGLPQTCPFQKGKIIQQSPSTYGIIKIEELNLSTNKPTGRYARFLHSNYFGFSEGDIVNFNDIVGREGKAGKNNPNAYATHSHFELTLKAQLNSTNVTVDTKRATKYPSGTLPDYFIAPTLEEIKCAHGLSATPLPLPEVSISGGVTNYKCIF
jgi:hypothetical protein